jgi:hypothetical protein
MVLLLFAAEVALGVVALKVAGEKEAYVGGGAPEKIVEPSLRDGVDWCCESKGSPCCVRGVDMCSSHGS